MSNAPIPDNASKPGWPELLEDNTGLNYLRIRDGEIVDAAQGRGMDCLYVLLDPDEKPLVDPETDSMYTPALGSTQYNVSMNSSRWTPNEQLAAAGQPLWEIPEDYQ